MRPILVALISTAALLAQAPAGKVLVGKVLTGKDMFEKRCTGCHALENDRTGPMIRGVYGRKAGTAGAFAYSDALKNSGLTWTPEVLDKWLSDPDQLVPGNDMAFRVAKQEERAAIIEYLRTLPASVDGAKR